MSKPVRPSEEFEESLLDTFDEDNWFTGSDREVGRRFLNDGCPPEVIEGFADLDADTQASIRKQCGYLNELVQARRRFATIDAKWHRLPIEKWPPRVAKDWIDAHDTMQASWARLKAVIAEFRGEFQTFPFEIDPSLPLTDQHRD